MVWQHEFLTGDSVAARGRTSLRSGLPTLQYLVRYLYLVPQSIVLWFALLGSIHGAQDRVLGFGWRWTTAGEIAPPLFGRLGKMTTWLSFDSLRTAQIRSLCYPFATAVDLDLMDEIRCSIIISLSLNLEPTVLAVYRSIHG